MKKIIIKGLWVGKELSLLEQTSINSFIKNGHEYHLYIYNYIKNIPREVVIKDANEIVSEPEIYKSKYTGLEGHLGFSDYFRVKLIYEKGGMWSDLDTICLRPFDFNENYIFSSSDFSNGVNASPLMCPKKSLFLKEIYNKIRNDKIKETEDGRFLDTLFLFIKKFGFEKYIKDKRVFSFLNIKNLPLIINRNYYKSMFEGCYSVHLSRQFWLYNKKKLKLEKNNFKNKVLSNAILDFNKIYPKNTPYGYWQDKYL